MAFSPRLPHIRVPRPRPPPRPWPPQVAIKEVHDVLLKYYAQLYGAFVYYAAGGSSDPYHLSLNAFTTLLDDCGISDK